MEEKRKKIILTSIFLLIVLLSIIVCAIIYLKKQNNKLYNNEIDKIADEYTKIQQDPSILFNNEKLQQVTGETTYYTINNAIEKYSKYIEGENSEAVYSVLYEEYIKQNNLTQQNVLEKLNKCTSYKINEMYGISAEGYGIYYTKIYNENINEFLMINRDLENDTFSISPIDEEMYNQGIKQGIQVDKERLKEIEKNEFNKIVNQNLDQDNIATKYFEDFIEKIVYYPEEAYDCIDKEYKNKNFEDYVSFEEYVNLNLQRFENLDRSNLKEGKDFSNYEDYEKYIQEKLKYYLADYVQVTENGIKKYIFKDSYGKYYIFKVSAAMKYTVILDNYTIPTEDFIQTYNESSEVEKVVLNIKRFFMGIDDKNYGYSYSVLSESYRANKYPTKDAFVQYAKQYFFEENEIEYISCEKQNGLYIYKIKIKDATGKNTETKSLNMIVKLNDGTDFEMSFGTD